MIGGKVTGGGTGGIGARPKRRRLSGDKRVGFVDLVAGHNLRKCFEAICVGIVAGSDRAGVPGIGGDIVERHALAVFVEIGEKGLGVCVALFSCEDGPVGGL